MRLRIVVAEDNPAFLRELTAFLSTEFEVVATATDGRTAVECIARCQPDVVVMDLEMPVLNGLEATRELMQDPSKPAVVICSVETDPEIVDTAREAGALGYVFKPRMASDLIPAVKAAARGESFVSPS
jgi:DNA-binding NarL/FixJ family response regulator